MNAIPLTQFKQWRFIKPISIHPFIWILIFVFLSGFIHVIASDKSYPELRGSIDTELQKAFEKTLDQKFVKGMKAKKPEAEVYRKSGTWRTYHADSGVITQKDKEYIIVALVQHQEGGQGLTKLIEAVDELMDNEKK